MKKKILIIILILVVFISAGVVYLNNVVLPVKIKSLLVQGIEERTQKKASIEALRFNIFKGLVVKNLVIYDEKEIIISVKEGSCFFLLTPFFKRMVVIPVLALRSPEIFVQRRKDNTFNLADLFPKKPAPTTQKKPAFGIYIYKVGIRDARISFRDETFEQPFTKQIERLDLDLYFSIPDKVKFNLMCDILGNPLANIKSSGEYRIFSRQFSSRSFIRNLSLKDFSPYYQQTKITVSEGLLDAQMDLSANEGTLSGDISLDSKNFMFSWEKASAKLNSAITGKFQYGLGGNKFVFSGKATLNDSAVSGLGLVDALQDISGEFNFDNSGISSEGLKARFLGVPTEAKIKLSNFAKPVLSLNVVSSLSLNSLQAILKNKFNFNIPAAFMGDSKISLNIETTIPPGLSSQINGSVDLMNAALTPEKFNFPLEEINGRIEFLLDQLKWADLSFKHAGAAYKTSGVLSNFNTPHVQAKLSSDKLLLESNFIVDKKAVTISKLTGRYLNSDFAIDGSVDISEQPLTKLALSGGLNFDLRDTKAYLKKYEKELDRAALSGLVNAQFVFKDDTGSFKSWALKAKLTSPLVSAYGLKFQQAVIDYNQLDGLIDIPLAQAAFYDGILKLAGKMNLNSDNMPYQLSAGLAGVKIEKLKLDTPLKDKDVAGTVNAGVKLSGFSGDLSKLNGAGEIFINDGKLWQLDLFKGVGSLIFVKDFANVTFKDGSCAFFIQDKYIFSDNLKLTSDIADLSGAVKINFDSAIEATLDVKVNSDMVPMTGTFRDVTTAIAGEAGKFGTIKISGTLSAPKFKFQAAVVDIIKGLKNIFLKKQ